MMSLLKGRRSFSTDFVGPRLNIIFSISVCFWALFQGPDTLLNLFKESYLFLATDTSTSAVDYYSNDKLS
jgi:hypothetical protein